MLHTKTLLDLAQAVREHFQVVFNQLDPVQPSQNLSKSRNSVNSKNLLHENVQQNAKFSPYQPQWNGHFAFAFAVFVYSLVDVNFGLLYEATGQLTLKLSELQTSPYIIFHQVVPRVLWAETDNLLLLNAATTTTLLAILVFKSRWPERAKLFLKEQGVIVVDGQGKLFDKNPNIFKF